jgi:hypothetical protein
MMTMMLITGRNEEGFIEAEGASQSLLQGQGHLHEGQPCLSMACLQKACDGLPSLTGTRRLFDL